MSAMSAPKYNQLEEKSHCVGMEKIGLFARSID